MTKTIKLLSCTALLCISGLANAKITLPDIISDNMVLQHSTVANIWGTAAPGATVRIELSWGKAVCTKADDNGRWKVGVTTGDASYTTHSMAFYENGAKNSDITLNNILFGEVWFASGQSNMEMPLSGFDNCPVEGANETIADAGNWPGIRFATIPKTGAMTPQESVSGKWQTNSPATAQWFSATAYYFARRMNRILNVPVGIINCSWGGTMVEGWLPKEILQGYDDIDLNLTLPAEDSWWHHMTPLVMYNGMLHPLHNYTIKGFLWYQGESNVGSYKTYSERLATMVRVWREKWGQGDIPFYFAEIAPYNYGGNGIDGALLREQQFKASKIIPNSGMITTNDLVYDYEYPQIHPAKKQEVGDRLAYLALEKTYGINGIQGCSPAFREMRTAGNKVEVLLDNAQQGLSPWVGIVGFEVAGADRVFHPAKAEIDMNKKSIIVWSDEVASPEAVRYCFKDFCPGNVVNGRGLPLIPFRSDNW